MAKITLDQPLIHRLSHPATQVTLPIRLIELRTRGNAHVEPLGSGGRGSVAWVGAAPFQAAVHMNNMSLASWRTINGWTNEAVALRDVHGRVWVGVLTGTSQRDTAQSLAALTGPVASGTIYCQWTEEF